MVKLILFDIDGTLVLTGGAGMRAMSLAFRDLFGVPDALVGVTFAGRTDRAIVEDVAARHLGNGGLTPEAFAQFCDRYVEHLEREIQVEGPGKAVLPGVRPLLDALAARADVRLALLTGNLEPGARIKLNHFGLWNYFPWGAFGEQAVDRTHLMPVALQRGRAAGDLPDDPRHVFVVGDTPHDVACAQAAAAVAVGVATGPFSTDALRASGADEVFEDLSDTARFVSMLDGLS